LADAPQLTERQLNRATLHRQLLLRRAKTDVVDAVRAVGALQAQVPASPYLALWNRVSAFDPAELDRAFARHRVVKATLMRMTVHVVTAEDYPAFHRAMVHDLRRGRLGDPRFTRSGLSVVEADALMPDVVAFAIEPRTKAELEAMIAERAGDLAAAPVWWAYRYLTPIVHAPTSGPWSFGDRASYVAARSAPFDRDREAAIAVLVRRYLEAFGPASVADIGQFSRIPQPSIKAAIALLGDDLVTRQGPDGKALLDVPDGPIPAEDVPTPPRLLPMFDNVLLAYQDRRRIVPEAYRRIIAQNNGDTLPTVLVNGHVAGVWRPAPENAASIEVTAFHPLDGDTWAHLEDEARSLVAFLADRQPDVFRRYGHWWKGLPSGDVRILAR
jgi:hypothetical protein